MGIHSHGNSADDVNPEDPGSGNLGNPEDSEAGGLALPVDPVKLIAIDIDGTLLNKSRTLTAKTSQVIAQACAKGIHIVIATARPPRSVWKIYKHLKLDTWQINHNGALIYEPATQKVIAHHTIDSAVAQQVVAITRQIMPGINIGVEILDTLYTDQSDSKVDASYAGVTHAGGHLDAILHQPITKIFMTGDVRQLAHIQMTLQEKLHDKISFAISHMQLLQVVGAKVNKVHALKHVAKHYNVPRESVMAIGDAPNDLDMLKWAGLSIAVKNAWSEVLGAVHFVVPSNHDDGVAHAIKKYAL